MGSEPSLDPELKDDLKRELRAIGPNVLDLERTLRNAGFRGVDVWNDMIRGFAETPDELSAFDRSREAHAAKKFANPADFSEDHFSPAELKFQATRFADPIFQPMLHRFRETFEEDAARFAAPLQGQGSFWSKEDRLMAGSPSSAGSTRERSTCPSNSTAA